MGMHRERVTSFKALSPFYSFKREAKSGCPLGSKCVQMQVSASEMVFFSIAQFLLYNPEMRLLPKV